MCQLTLLDIDPKTKLGKSTIRLLTEINSVGIIGESPSKNQDGFGYVTFSKSPEITKTPFNAIEWWKDNEDEFHKSTRNPNGIYHVRAASGNPQTLWQKDAHPFHHGNLILAHNGTLTQSKKLDDLLKTDEYKDFFPDEAGHNHLNVLVNAPMIDSERFTKMLAHKCGEEKLTPQHIIDTLELFHGTFAFLIHDLSQSKNAFVVRGKTKELYEAIIHKGNQKIGLVLNTSEWELFYWARIIKQIARNMLGYSVTISIREVPKESIFMYKLGSYDLGESIEKVEQSTKPIASVKNANKVYPNSRGTRYNGNYNEEIEEEIVDLSLDLNFTLKELWIFSEIVLGQSIHTADELQLDLLKEVLLEIRKTSEHQGRKDVWDKWLEEKEFTHSPLRAYSLLDISYPAILNSKKLLKSKMKKADKIIANEVK